MQGNIRDGGLRQTLRIGAELAGKKSGYVIERPLHVSGRSITYLCRDDRGRKLRLKLYSGECSMRGDVREAYLSLPAIRGILRREDDGEWAGVPFDVFRHAADSADRQHIPLQVIGRLAGQMSDMLDRIHAHRMLVRDLNPRHLLYDADSGTCALAAFSNLALLPEGATATRASSYPESGLYRAPECERMGESVYSDYYAMGATLFEMLRGSRAVASLGQRQIDEWKRSGDLPGVDSEAIRSGDFRVMTGEQRLMYLILGLTNPDPQKRWLGGEVRVWCGGHQIPLVQTGRRIRYQMSAPIQIGKVRCWDYDQLAEEIARHARALEGRNLAPLLERHVQKFSPEAAKRLREIALDAACSEAGRVCKCVYALYPQLSGLWWRGKRYESSAELAAEARGSAAAFAQLQQMLRDRVFSHLLEQRRQVGGHAGALENMRRLETCERQEPRQGASRFILTMGGEGRGRGLAILGKAYGSIDGFIRRCASNGKWLFEHSGEVLKDPGFQAWMWLMGGEQLIRSAVAQLKDSADQAFWLLMQLLERMAGEKRLARALYLERSAFAPIVHLIRNLDAYEAVGNDRHAMLRLQRLDISPERTLEQLNALYPEAVESYRAFVRECRQAAYYRPRRAEYAFSVPWNGLEVSAAFMRWLGEAAPGG